MVSLSTLTCSVYHELENSSGIEIMNVTDGVIENTEKSWLPACIFVDVWINACRPHSAAASGKPGSPTLTLYLSSKHTNIANLSNTAYSRLYLNIQACNENLHVLFSTAFAESAF